MNIFIYLFFSILDTLWYFLVKSKSIYLYLFLLRMTRVFLTYFALNKHTKRVTVYCIICGQWIYHLNWFCQLYIVYIVIYWVFWINISLSFLNIILIGVKMCGYPTVLILWFINFNTVTCFFLFLPVTVFFILLVR